MTQPHIPEQPVVYGATYSVYVQIVRLTLLEKDVDYILSPVDIFSKSPEVEQYRQLNPFCKIPSFSHLGEVIYETSAIVRYINDAFPGKNLLPCDALVNARVNQIISIIDNYAYPAMVWGVYISLVEDQMEMSEQKVEKAVAETRVVLKALSSLRDKDHKFLVGGSLTLADLYAVPVFNYLVKTEIGNKLLSNSPSLKDWWTNINQRQQYEKLLSAGPGDRSQL